MHQPTNHRFCLKNIVILFLFIYNTCAYSQVQPVEVIKSTEKINLNGDVFFVHIVKKGETLYSIARAYGMSVNEVIAKNPQAANEIKVDQILRIPEKSSPQVTSSQKEPVNNGTVTHEIASGQTLYGIARVYGVSVNDIMQANPNAKFDSLKVGQQLVIPVEKKKPSVLKNIDSTKYVKHIVVEKETLYSLARKYNVQIDDITNTNESLNKNGLIIGSEILIPIALHDSINVTSPVNATNVSRIKLTDCISNNITVKEINVALMLPLFSMGSNVQENEQLDDNQNEEKILQKNVVEFDPLGMNFIEFYQGILMACDELKKEGLKIQLNTYDTEKGIAKIDEIENKPDFKKNNIIIGPVFPEQIDKISKFSEENNIFLVSPITNSGNVLKKNPYFFQINPGISREIEENINVLLNDSAQNILVVYNSSLPDSVQFNNFKKSLKAKLGAKADSIKEINVFNNDFSQVLSSLDSLKCNYVLSPSIDEIFVSNLLGILSTKLIYCRIHVVGMLEWTRFKGIDMNYLHDLQLVYHSAYYTDFENEDVKDFLKKYRLLFGTEPYKTSKYGFNYCMLGYDIANYFILGYAHYGNSLRESLHCIKTKPLVAPMKFLNTSPESGFINTYLQTVQYSRDYNIQRVDIK